jgi:hypothetical protein
VGQAADVVFTVQDRLVQVGDAPPVGDVVPKLRTQPLGRLTGVGVPPGTEWRQQLVVGIEGQIAVHHRGHAECPDCGQLDAVPLPDVGGQRGVTVLQPVPHGLERVRPHPVHELVLPLVAADGERFMIWSDQYRFDPGRAKLDPEGSAALGEVGKSVGRHTGRTPLLGGAGLDARVAVQRRVRCHHGHRPRATHTTVIRWPKSSRATRAATTEPAGTVGRAFTDTFAGIWQAADDLGNRVGDTGIEPVTSSV